jgi:hypothetical protein
MNQATPRFRTGVVVGFIAAAIAAVVVVYLSVSAFFQNPPSFFILD